MVYTSGTAIYNDRTSNYDLKLAKSDDFFNWKSTGNIVIPLDVGETNISTPSIIKYNEKFHMCFSVKPKSESIELVMHILKMELLGQEMMIFLTKNRWSRF